MSPDLELTLIALLVVLIIVIFLVGFFLVMWLVNLNKLTVSLTQNSELFRMELKPILDEVQVSLQKINVALSAAGRNVGQVHKIVMSLMGILSLLISSFRAKSGGFLKGIIQGFSCFLKK